MTAFKEFAIGKFVLRFYKTDHVWTCTVFEDMLDEVSKEIALQTLSDIGQAIESESFDRTASHMADEYVSYRELTDEEMLEVYKKVFNKQNEFKENLKRRSYFNFARAVLKKASEK